MEWEEFIEDPSNFDLLETLIEIDNEEIFEGRNS